MEELTANSSSLTSIQSGMYIHMIKMLTGLLELPDIGKVSRATLKYVYLLSRNTLPCIFDTHNVGFMGGKVGQVYR